MTIPTTPREAVALWQAARAKRGFNDNVRADLWRAGDALLALLNPQEGAEGKGIPHAASGNVFTNEIGQRVSLWMHNLPSGQIALEMTRGPSVPEGFVLSRAEAAALAAVAARHSPVPAHAGLVETIAPFVKAAQFVNGWPADWPDDDYGCVDKAVVDAITVGQWRALAALSATLSEGGET